MPTYLPDSASFESEYNKKDEYEWRLCYTHGMVPKRTRTWSPASPSSRIMLGDVDCAHRFVYSGPTLWEDEVHIARLGGTQLFLEANQVLGGIQTRAMLRGVDSLAIFGYSIVCLLSRLTGPKILIPSVRELKMSNILARRIIDILPENVFVAGC